MATLVASIGVGSLQTTEPYFDHFIVEIYSDSGYTTKIGSNTSTGVLTAGVWTQNQLILFNGLKFAVTYYLRSAVVITYGALQSAWTNFSLSAGTNSPPTSTYTDVAVATSSGVSYDVTIVSPNSDINHYEWVYTKDGSTPAAAVSPTGKGIPFGSSTVIHVFIGGVPGDSITFFFRAVNTSMLAQTWQALGTTAITSTSGNIDGIAGLLRVKVEARGSSYTGVGAAALYTGGSGLVLTGLRSYNLVVMSRATMAVTYTQTYDIYASGVTAATALATELNSLTDSSIVFIFTGDEPQTSRLLGGLPAAIYRCGGTPNVFASTKFKFRSAYLLIGYPGSGQGNGLEMYAGAIDYDTIAFCEANILIDNGDAQGLSGGQSSASQVNPSTGDVQNSGSLPPSLVSAVGYTSTTTSITWSGTVTVYRTDTDGGTLSISVSETCTGLSSGTAYYFYGYYDEIAQTIGWVTGGSGSPAIAFTTPGLVQAQAGNLANRLALSQGPMAAGTVATGSGSGYGGGSDGGSGGCLREDMIADVKGKGATLLCQLKVGDLLRSENDTWVEVTALDPYLTERWLEIVWSNRERSVCTPGHQWPLLSDGDEEQPMETARRLSMMSVVPTIDGFATPASIKVMSSKWRAIRITTSGSHLFYTGYTKANVLTHNFTYYCT